jgi:hypothetical protein
VGLKDFVVGWKVCLFGMGGGGRVGGEEANGFDELFVVVFLVGLDVGFNFVGLKEGFSSNLDGFGVTLGFRDGRTVIVGFGVCVTGRFVTGVIVGFRVCVTGRFVTDGDVFGFLLGLTGRFVTGVIVGFRVGLTGRFVTDGDAFGFRVGLTGFFVAVSGFTVGDTLLWKVDI